MAKGVVCVPTLLWPASYKDATTSMKSKSKLQYNLILKYLKTVTSLNEVKTKLIGLPEIDSIVPFFQNFERNIQNKGVRDTIDLYKLLRRIGQCIALNTAFDPLPRRKVIRGTEIPVLLKELLPFLQGNSMSKRLGLTALNVVSTLRLPPSSDITAITEAGVELNPNLLNEFRSFVKRSKFLGRNKWIRKVNTNKPITGYFSSKNGPNGPSMRSCDLDAYALSRDPELNKSVEALLQIGGDPVIVQVFIEMSKATVGLSEHYEKLNPIQAKISQIAEGGGKTRNIAIIDYWSQNALMFIHDHLMLILKKMKQDATYNQEDIFTLSRDYALKAGCCYSFDLSSATDRFPLALQTIIIEKMFGCEVMDL